jgi:hypothetical protein
MWSYSVNESINVDPASISFNPTGDFYKDIASFCELAKIRVHPFLRESNSVLVSIIPRKILLSCKFLL